MSNLCQPQGVILAITLSVVPPAGFHPVEFIENNQVTIPNLVNIDGTGNSGTAELVVNDGLLRTHQDSMVFAIDNTGGEELTLNLYIAKQPVTDITAAKEKPADYFSETYPIVIKAAEKRHLELRLISGQYVLSDRDLDLPTA